MIADSTNDDWSKDVETDILTAFEDSNEPFFLTGSWFFGHQHDESDVDFIAQNCDEVNELLDRLGFSDDILSYHGVYDNQTYAVRGRGKVQVQLALNAEVKRCARSGIRQFNSMYHKEADTNDRVRLWNDWYEILARVYPQPVRAMPVPPDDIPF